MSSTEKAIVFGQTMAATAMSSDERDEKHDGTEEAVVSTGQKTIRAATITTNDTQSSCQQDSTTCSSYTDHDTLGLHDDDKPNKGGVLPDATASIEGGVSVITQPEFFPVNHVKIMPSVNEKVIVDNVIDNSTRSGSTPSNSTSTGAAYYSKNSKSTNKNDNNASSTTVTTSASSTTSKTKLIASAKHNLQAGKSALEKSDFDTAADYFKAGRKQLNDITYWDDDEVRPILLELCIEGAHTCYITGEHDITNELIDEVLHHGNTIQEKFRVYEVKMLTVMATGNYQESLSLGLDVRKQLGLSTPSYNRVTNNKVISTMMILKRYGETTRRLGNRTAEELANLPELQDERIIMGQRMLELLLTSCYQVQPTLFPLLIFEIMNTTLEFGINASSCDAFTTFGILLSGPFGKPQQGREMAKAAELILSTKPGASRMQSRSANVIQGFINHWTMPLRETLTPLLEGYKAGRSSGDFESAKLCLGFRVVHTFHAGYHLNTDLIAEAINLHINFLHPDITTELWLQIYLLAIKKLCNIELEENEKDFDGILQTTSEGQAMSSLTMQCYTNTIQLELYAFFGDWEEAKSLLLTTSDVRAILQSPYPAVRHTFFEGLICIKAAQSSVGKMDSWKWKRRALKSMKFIRRWIELGNVNIIHCLHLLEAELALLNGKNEKRVEDFYKSAIDIAAKNQFIQDEALSNELASSYFGSLNNVSRRNYYLGNAIRCYSEWGATAKVEQLNQAE